MKDLAASLWPSVKRPLHMISAPKKEQEAAVNEESCISHPGQQHEPGTQIPHGLFTKHLHSR